MKALFIVLAILGCRFSRNADPVVGIAFDMMQEDLRLVTDKVPEIRVIQYNRERVNLARLGVPKDIADSLKFTKEAFYVGKSGQQIIVVGSDGHGAAYGALEVSRLAGVSPWVWWGDSMPERRDSFDLPEGFSTFQHPSVEYRGIFLNDEDWAFRPWSAQHFSPQSDRLTISADTYREVFKLVLRLRGNAIWPGMHNGTKPFFQVEGAKAAADSCGIYIGTSHCEPLLRNNVGEWDHRTRGRYNYLTNREQVIDYWTERLVEVKGAGDLFTIGMRGIHDGSMEGLERASLDEKTAALQQVIADQRELLRKYIDKDVTRVPQMFMPYKEVLEIMENGLELPDDVTIIWCDDNYGYMTRLSDPAQQKRSGGSGVYYHLSYAGRPHDVLWLSTAQSGLIYHEMMEAYRHNARKVWIANVHDPKVAGYDLEFFMDMAWNVNFVQPGTVGSHLESWLEREFGSAAAQAVFEPMLEFYRLTSMRKPEFFGWNQVELDANKYPLGLSPVQDTQFSFREFGNEAQRYIDRFRTIRKAVEEAETLVPERQRDAYFAFVRYPVGAAESMAEKMLYAQKARQRATTTYAPGIWDTDTVLLASCALSQKAYYDIKSLTAHYNSVMAGGKWMRNMNDMPRHLYETWAPGLPVMLRDADIEKWAAYGRNWKADDISSSGDDYYAADACRWKDASFTPRPVRNLGHSANAVPVPAGESLGYEFSTSRDGKAVVRVAVIPTQANDRGDICFSISIDGAQPRVFSIKEPYRSDRWKENVSRQQRVVELPLENLPAGRHTLRLGAVDDHIIFDQWMVDYNTGRKFYLFPL